MFNAEHRILESIRDQLELALGYHAAWYERFNRTLVCRLPPAEDDLAADAEQRCRFGRWYHRHAGQAVREHPAFPFIGIAHRKLHRQAAELLASSSQGAPISTQAYDRCAEAHRQLQLQMESLRYEVDESIYSLDPLTGLFTRKAMPQRLRELHERVKRGVEEVALVMVDLDRFKRLNDRWGHPCGDQVLQATGQRVLASIRPYDQAFRYGGEEFLIGLPDTDIDTAAVVVERLRGAIESMDLTCESGAVVRCTASFGIAALDADISLEQALGRADAALYAAKRRGRNRSVCWTPRLKPGR